MGMDLVLNGKWEESTSKTNSEQNIHMHNITKHNQNVYCRTGRYNGWF